MEERASSISRATAETEVEISLILDGTGKTSVSTGFGFADHMLTLLGYWAGFDLKVTCRGDLEVDVHHSLEDIGLCLGTALEQSLGERKGIQRVGWAKIPMDEALTEVVIDLSGRPYFVYTENLLPPVIAGEEKDVWREFFKSFAFQAKMNLHMHFLYGQNGHHLLESATKGLGLALRNAVAATGKGIFSTKGSLQS
ncbi:MAG: imidazoleglycerol-phosphate dehydratase HisB [Desulfovibrionales bacterium]